MNEVAVSYLPILLFALVAFGLATAIAVMGLVMGRGMADGEKISPYECGFEPIGKMGVFNVRFYIVAMLFVIFDLELVFLFPWAVTLGGLEPLGFWSMMIFLAVLVVGLVYEWRKGALEWN